VLLNYQPLPFANTHQMKNPSVLALPCPCPCPCHVGDCGVRGKRCRFEPGSREIKRPHVPVRPVMPALPHGLEILMAQHRLNFCTRHSPFDKVGGQTEPLKADQAPTAAAEKFLFATGSISGDGIACFRQCHPSFTAPYSVRSVVRQFRSPQYVLD
jgi:hypothetical protein